MCGSVSRHGKAQLFERRAWSTRIATPENEDSLVEVALGATAAHMDRIAACSYRRALDRQDGKDPAPRYLRRQWNDDGSLAIDGQLNVERGGSS